ncbi:hypothetical protein JYT86_00350 [bacterium AH-315-N03]|nr:hypothetical protein [bacterium AH-315-N03]
MWMRKTLKNSLVVVLLALVGACTADVGERTDTLRAIDEQAMTSQLLFLRPDISPFPMTSLELEESGTDVTLAIPIRVEVFEELAVAWFAPGGVARVTRDGVIAVWEVENYVPLSGELNNNAEVGLVVAGDAPVFLYDPREASSSVPRAPSEQITGLEASSNLRDTILDFYNILTNDRQATIFAQIGGFHPGCLDAGF